MQSQFGTLDDYRRGLQSRDIVARERAFQRAAAEKREDAIPYLVEEVAKDGLLSVYAARCLALLGKRSESIDHALISGLATTSNKEELVKFREACADFYLSGDEWETLAPLLTPYRGRPSAVSAR